MSGDADLEVGWVAIDCADPPALAGWWKQLIGGEVHADYDGDVALPGGPVELLFLAVPDDKVTKNRLHLDLRTSDYDGATDRAVVLGAVAGDDIYVGDRWRVFRHPEGNEFCIIRPK